MKNIIKWFTIEWYEDFEKDRRALNIDDEKLWRSTINSVKEAQRINAKAYCMNRYA